MVKHSHFRECARRSGIPTVCYCVGKGLKLEEDLIKPNPTHWSVHWLKLSQARGIATVLMYGERRRGTDKPKGYARGKVWLGACRKCSGFNGATH